MFSRTDRIYSVSDESLSTYCSGGFSDKVLVLVRAETFDSDAAQFLTKILAASGISLETGCLLAQIPEGKPLRITPLVKDKQPGVVLVFGLKPDEICLAIDPPYYKITEFYGTRWIMAHSLETLQPDKKLKSGLWTCMQQVFPAGA